MKKRSPEVVAQVRNLLKTSQGLNFNCQTNQKEGDYEEGSERERERIKSLKTKLSVIIFILSLFSPLFQTQNVTCSIISPVRRLERCVFPHKNYCLATETLQLIILSSCIVGHEEIFERQRSADEWFREKGFLKLIFLV